MGATHYKLKIKKDVTLEELAEIVEKSFNGGASELFHDALTNGTKRHLAKLNEAELKIYNETGIANDLRGKVK